jgi:hypothetical protein
MLFNTLNLKLILKITLCVINNLDKLYNHVSSSEIRTEPEYKNN